MSKWKIIRKATSLTSLRLNWCNIIQIIQKCKMLTRFINTLGLGYYSVVFIKNVNLLSLRHWCFPGKFRNFLKEQKQPSEVFCKKDFVKRFPIFTEKTSVLGSFLIMLLQAAAFSTAALLKRDSNTGALLWILRNF